MHRDPEPRFLRTVHGTVVYQDRGTGVVRHGPWKAAARNLPFSSGTDGMFALPMPGERFAVRAGRAEEIALQRDNLFLCADKGGRVTHSRAQASAWETFVPVSADVLDVLDVLESADWLIEPTHETARGAGVRRKNGWVAEISGYRIDLRDDPSAFTVFGRSAEGEVERFSFRIGAYGTFLARRHDPLVYYCVFGSDSYFRCLGLSIESLCSPGDYRGTIAVVCDRSEEEVASFLPAAAKARVLHRRYDAKSRNEMLYARYLALDTLPGGHRPVLYLDADVVVDRPIAPLLAHLHGSRLLVATERRLYPEWHGMDAFALPPFANWFGRWLLIGHEDARGRELVLGSSGIIGMADLASAAPVFRLVRELAARLEHVDAKTLAKYTDQALLDYVLARTGMGDSTTLDAFVSYASSKRSAEPGRGLMHFHAGVGRSTWKEEAMQAYLASLLHSDG